MAGLSLSRGLSLGLGVLFRGGGSAPNLSNSNSQITATNGQNAAPRLTNDNSEITAEAA